MTMPMIAGLDARTVAIPIRDPRLLEGLDRADRRLGREAVDAMLERLLLYAVTSHDVTRPIR